MTHYVSGKSTARTTAGIERPSVHFNSIYLWTISLVAALGGLLFGYDWVAIAGAEPFYEKYFHPTNASQQG
jgi:MFS transporter, SP family, xylose:H+ symportor